MHLLSLGRYILFLLFSVIYFFFSAFLILLYYIRMWMKKIEVSNDEEQSICLLCSRRLPFTCVAPGSLQSCVSRQLQTYAFEICEVSRPPKGWLWCSPVIVSFYGDGYNAACTASNTDNDTSRTGPKGLQYTDVFREPKSITFSSDT